MNLPNRIGVSVETLRRWDRSGRLPAKRTQAQSSLKEILNIPHETLLKLPNKVQC